MGMRGVQGHLVQAQLPLLLLQQPVLLHLLPLLLPQVGPGRHPFSSWKVFLSSYVQGGNETPSALLGVLQTVQLFTCEYSGLGLRYLSISGQFRLPVTLH
jgi:hypothetical protein